MARLPTAVAQAGGADASVVLDAYDKRLPGFNVHIPPPGGMAKRARQRASPAVCSERLLRAPETLLTPRPWNTPAVPANASLLGLSTPPSNSSMGDWGNGVCKKGLWQEAPNAALENGAVLPLVQCWRNPPCVRWNYATPQRCKAYAPTNCFARSALPEQRPCDPCALITRACSTRAGGPRTATGRRQTRICLRTRRGRRATRDTNKISTGR